LQPGFQAHLLPAHRFRPLLRRRGRLRLPLTRSDRIPAGIAARREAGILSRMPDAIAIVTPEPPWELFRARLLDYVRRRLDDPAEAEDLVQEVLARVSGRLPELRTREHLLPWLYRITRNALIDHYRARGRRQPVVALDTVMGAGPGSLAIGEDEDPGADARAALARCVEPMLATLPPAYREALHRVELLGERQVDVAEELGLGISALKSRVQRGRKLLHAAFTDCCALERDSTGGVVGFERRDGVRCRP
jgi:RNA polymerase sigma-70 factor (ECF subfamily)